MTRLAVFLSSILAATASVADDAALTGAERAFFENEIRPALVKYCYECHARSAKKVGGGLLLDSRAGLLKGGQSGPAVVAGHPEQSLLIDALRYDGLEMPPDQPIPLATIRHFETWVRRGAKYPAESQTEAAQEKDDFDPGALWSFLPRTKSAAPAVKQADWPRDSLDHFVLAKVEAAGHAPAADAPPRTLIRRLHYDLIGLPPTVEEIEAFETACAADRRQATEALVDSLLSRPQFGERWARHWLDVAKYAESNGDDGLGRNATFPYAWRYRDYVIDALNRDVPYDRFLTEQIAGDLLPANNATERNRQLVATGFLAVAAKPASAMNKNFAMDIVDNQIHVVSTAVMGLSVACARCHDHKHDPISTRDYYALAGIFTSTETLYGAAANEKLTAPPTPLHTLLSQWSANASPDAPDPAKAPLVFSAAYDAAVETLSPTQRLRLDQQPEGVTSQAVESYSETEFAKVKNSSIHGQLDGFGDRYSVSFWVRNTLPLKQRPITAYVFSRAKRGDKSLPGDHIGIGGKHEPAMAGKLFVFNGNQKKTSLKGSTVLPPNTWNHVLLTRDQTQVRLYLNGSLEIEGESDPMFGDSPDYCFAQRSDAFAPLEGNLADAALWPRVLSAEEVTSLFNASGRPRGVRSLGVAMGVRERPKVADCKIHVGGDVGKLGAVVPRSVLPSHQRVLQAWMSESPRSGERSHAGHSVEQQNSAPKIEGNRSGRLELAAWLTDPRHPQTSRVIVNRIWLHLFGRGIVVTPDDFGVYGARPTHPELLDHLANEFVADQWSMKRFIRRLVLSRTYQLDSHADPSLTTADPDNEWFARRHRRRLDAESLRDSILHASGQLELHPAEGSVVNKIDRLINWPPGEATNLHQPSRHRSIYLCMLRHAPPPELAAFDLPDGIGDAGQRDETTSPTQSLFLLNNPFVIQQSNALAAAVLADKDQTNQQRIQRVFRRILKRNPTISELDQAIGYIEGLPASLGEEATPVQIWSGLCQALMATNEFRYID